MSLFSLLHACFLVSFDINAVVLLLLLCVCFCFTHKLFYISLLHFQLYSLHFPSFSFTLVNMLLSAKQNYKKKILVSLCCSFWYCKYHLILQLKVVVLGLRVLSFQSTDIFYIQVLIKHIVILYIFK